MIKFCSASGHTNSSTGDQIDEKNNQWFGASLYSSGEDGPVVVSPFYFLIHKLRVLVQQYEVAQNNGLSLGQKL